MCRDRLVSRRELAEKAGCTRQAVERMVRRHWDFPRKTVRDREMYPLRAALAFIRRCRAAQAARIRPGGLFGANDPRRWEDR